MSIEQIPEGTESMGRFMSPKAFAIALGYGNFESVVERHNIPQQAHVLGIGASVAAFGEEVAFYRSDIHWTNLTDQPSDTQPELAPEGPNFTHETWDLATIDDIFPETHFDHIYAHGDDLRDVAPERLQALGKALVRLLNDGGKIEMIRVDENFIEHALLRESRLTYSKAKVVRPQKHLAKLPESSLRGNLEPLHAYGRGVSNSPASDSPYEKFTQACAVAAGAVYDAAGALYDAYSKLRRRRR